MDVVVDEEIVRALGAALMRFDGTSVDLELYVNPAGTRLDATLTYDRAKVSLSLGDGDEGLRLSWKVHKRRWYLSSGQLEFDPADEHDWSRALKVVDLIGRAPLIIRGTDWTSSGRPHELVFGDVVIDAGGGEVLVDGLVEVVLLPSVG